MTGDILNYKKHLAIHSDQYWKIHEEDTPHNSTRTSTGGAICMGTSKNKKGGFKFMTLGSMKKVVRRRWYSIPMTDTMIARVNELDQGKSNDLDLLDLNKRLIRDIDITGADTRETEAPQTGTMET